MKIEDKTFRRVIGELAARLAEVTREAVFIEYEYWHHYTSADPVGTNQWKVYLARTDRYHYFDTIQQVIDWVGDMETIVFREGVA